MRKPTRGRRSDSTGRSTKQDRHVRLTHFMLGSIAWKSLKPTERALYLEVLQRYTGYNNGSIGLGVLEAGSELHVKKHTAGLAFAALVDRGFLVMTRDSSFEQKKLTREWRVTCLPMGRWDAPTSPPTHDYARWRPAATGARNGTETAERLASEKQKPVPFGAPPSAVWGTDPPDKVPKGCDTGARNGTKAAPLRAVWGPPSISMAVGDGAASREAKPGQPDGEPERDAAADHDRDSEAAT